MEGLSSTPVIPIDTKDKSPSPVLPSLSTGHSKKPSDPPMLCSVIFKSDRRRSSAGEDPLQPIPPSPTLPTQSPSHFMSSTALRENKLHDGTDPPVLPNPRGNPHSRRPLNAATVTDDPAAVDHIIHPLHSASHVITSVGSAAHTLGTPAPTHTSSAVDSDNSEEHEHEEEPVDPTPFVFEPYHLASLVDPKNLESLEAIGGIEGLLAGLGTNPASGLRINGMESKSVDAPSDEEAANEGGAYTGTVEDRQRVYGSNVLPVRKSRSLLELMWLTLKDKVLVSLCPRSLLDSTLTLMPP
jgi:Ca2+-transporting ATPase